MSQRTFTLGRTLRDFAGNAVVGAPITVTPLVPGGFIAIDGSGDAVQSDPPLSTVTGGNGAWAIVTDYPGDFTTANVQVRINENGTTIDSPVGGFAYASTIDPTPWAAALSTSGKVRLRLVYVTDAGVPVGGALCTIQINQLAIDPNGAQVASSTANSVKGITDSTGTFAFWVWPSSVLNPVTTFYTARIQGESGTLTFTAPTATDLYRGAWDGATTYVAATGTSSGDVVLDSGVLYRCILGHTNHEPPNGTYWVALPSSGAGSIPTDLITQHYTPAVGAGMIAASTGNIVASPNLTTLIDDPHQTPASLDNNLLNLAARDGLALRTITADATLDAVTDDWVILDATSGAINLTFPAVSARERPYLIIKKDAAHSGTFVRNGTDTFNGATSFVLSTQFSWAFIKPDTANGEWFIQLGGGTGTVTSVAITLPAWLSVAGSPITGSGTLAVTGASQAAGLVVASPAATPGAVAPRALVGSDLPVFGPSGGGHAAGAVPDPGAIGGSTRFLREDATFAVPSGGSGTTATVPPPPAHLWKQAISPGAPTTVKTVTVVSDGRFNAFPSLTVCRDGALLLANYDGIDNEATAGGLVTLRRSTDGGATWTDGLGGAAGSKRILYTPPSGYEYSVFALRTLASGRILLGYVQENIPGANNDTIYVTHSDDNGATFVTPVAYNPAGSASVGGGNFLQCRRSGTVLLPCYSAPANNASILRSMDDGLTFGSPILVKTGSYSEMNLVELADHTLLAFVRFEDTTNGTYIFKSSDDGLTWDGGTALSASFNTYASQQTPVLVPVSGELILFYRGPTTGYSAWRWSADPYTGWSSETVVPGNFAYGSAVALGDHLVGIVYAGIVSGSQCDLHFLTMSTGVPVVSGVRNANPALASLLGGLAAQGEIVDTTTAGSASAGTTVGHNGTLIGTEGSLNLIDGANVTLTVADNPGAGRVDVTVAATGGKYGQWYDSTYAIMIDSTGTPILVPR